MENLTFALFYSEALSKALSALYAKLLVVLGLAFPVTEVIAKGVPDAYYQVINYLIPFSSVGFLHYGPTNLVAPQSITTQTIYQYCKNSS